MIVLISLFSFLLITNIFNLISLFLAETEPQFLN